MSKPYPAYKYSGVEWLGDVPEHWKVGLLKRYVRLRYGDALAADAREDGEIEVFGSNGVVGLHSRANTACPAIVVGRKGSFGKIVWAENGGFVIDTAYSIDRQTTDQVLRWVYYALQLLGLDQFSQDTGVPGLARERAYELEVTIPPVQEQTAIAAFLDHETAKIDALVEEQRRLIALLKEKRQAVISHAVTKGLNPNVPMKDSGIEWLGEVPEHWTVMPIRYSAKLESGHTPSRSRADWWENCTVPWFSLADVWQIRRGHADYIYETNEKVSEVGLANSSARLLPKGTVMLSRTASVGYSAIMGVDMATTQDFANWVCSDDLEPAFLLFVFRGMTKEFDRLMMGSTHNTIYMPDITMFRFARPPLNEQAEIVSFIRKQTAQIDNLIATAEKVVALSVERRAALISAAVTGKIDVRPSAKIIPLPVDRARVRGLVATEIIERVTNIQTLRRVKLQKLAYLAEAYADISELKGNYLREAAGPWDGEMMDEIDREVQAISSIVVERPRGAGTAVTYRTTKRTGRHRAELAALLGPDRMRKLDKLITDLTYIGKEGAEAIATLYAVWNDDLMDGKTPSDDDIVYGFLNDWHPEKPEKFQNPDDLHGWLDWMRRHSLTPSGTGPKTYRQLLV
ncbi:restriction endonuclease subunit S [Parvibaculum sp.]|uniref:restriction endonuclease subunit S n=1 Tax=Parvibaculum sp. TaxID=2024848 RepID=UPI002CEF93F5|nr:restriction endonuclease subunit S [Parvibaculum sp.]HUD51387.1 restriction endonuclease subunit S [Parvibaculum sp.]